MPKLACIRIPMLILLAVSCTGCQNAYIQPDDIQTIMSPSVRLEGIADIKLEPGEIVTDRYPSKGFGVTDQIAFVNHLKEELESSNSFLSINLNHDSVIDYRINILFHKTVASGRELLGIYYLDVELKIYDHSQLSLIRRYEVLTPENKILSFFTDSTIRATKARAANELHRRLMHDINEWLLDAGASNRRR